MASNDWLDLSSATSPSAAPGEGGTLSPQTIAPPISSAPLAEPAAVNRAALAAAETAGQSFDYQIQYSDPNNYAGSLTTAIEADMNAALQGFEGTLYGAGTLTVQLDIVASNASNAGELADGGPSALVPDGTLDGRTLETPAALYELDTGVQVSGSDITVEVPANSLGELYFDPDPAAGDNIASVAPAKYDGLTVFRHELTHGLGFISLRDTSTGVLGSAETEFDHYSSITSSGADLFVGPDAEAIYGAPVPLTTLDNGEQYSHLGNDPNGPLASDLMSGTGIMNGVTHQVSALDLAILRDIGVPESGALPCFAAGTRIATPQGEVAVEALRCGDLVLLARGGTAPVIWIGGGRIDIAAHPEPEQVAPIVIEAGAFADGLPARSLILSPDHALFFNETLIPAKALLNGKSVRQVHPSTVVYFHLELARHEVISAEGLSAETYLDTGNRRAFSSAGFFKPSGDRDLAAEQQRRRRHSCAAIAESGPVVESLRAQLLERAAITTTADPELSISAGRNELPALVGAQGLVEVELPAEAGDLIINSRNFVPGEATPDPRDRRRLGIAVSALELHRTDGWWTIALDDPALLQGWHAAESGHRWTNGRGIVPAGSLIGGSRLRVRFQAAAYYRLSASGFGEAVLS